METTNLTPVLSLSTALVGRNLAELYAEEWRDMGADRVIAYQSAHDGSAVVWHVYAQFFGDTDRVGVADRAVTIQATSRDLADSYWAHLTAKYAQETVEACVNCGSVSGHDSRCAGLEPDLDADPTCDQCGSPWCAGCDRA